MATQFMVRTASADFVREGRILADSKSAATHRAIDQHRKRLIELAETSGCSDTVKGELMFKAVRASILVATVEVITFEVGDTIAPHDDGPVAA